MGKWVAERVITWHTLYHAETNRLYIRDQDDSWQIFRAIATRTQRLQSRRFTPIIDHDEPPADAVCCTVRSDGAYTYVTGLGCIDAVSQQAEINDILKKLMNVTWDMWRPRNDILHNTVTAAKQR
jgi:hypothetical protein